MYKLYQEFLERAGLPAHLKLMEKYSVVLFVVFLPQIPLLYKRRTYTILLKLAEEGSVSLSERTTQHIQQAFYTLLKTKHFSDITVQVISGIRKHSLYGKSSNDYFCFYWLQYCKMLLLPIKWNI